MVWFQVDDGLSTSPKVLGISRDQRMAAVGLWTIAGSWCGRHLTDGRVPGFMLDEWGADVSLGTALVDAGLWRETSSGYRFHDWDKYQRTRSRIEEERERERTRKATYRAKSADQAGIGPAGSPAGVPGGQDAGHRQASGHPNRTIPNRTDPSKRSSDDDRSSEFSPDVIRLCAILSQLVADNGNRVGSVGVGWWTAARRLLDLDGYTPEQVEFVLRWSQQSEFWAPNIRSMPKLREKFDQLKAQAQADRSRGVSAFQRNLAIVDEYREGQR